MGELRRDRRAGLALFIFLSAVYLGTTPGRITYPDDEIVFQTTESLWLRRDLAIDGIPKRTGEPRHLPDGTFGWAEGRDGRRYGFFGHGLSVIALPAYAIADATAERVPATWRHAIRSDHYFFHVRGPRADWTRLVVSLTNTWVTALTAALLFAWLRVLAVGRAPALATALAYGLGTIAWAYTRTFLSEPLSALVLTASALMIARHQQGDPGERAPWLWGAGLLAGLAAHVHVLNLSVVPCLIGYAIIPLARGRRLWADRRGWAGALALGGLAVAGLGLDHALRFGSPLETGRYGHYSHFVAPWGGIAALLAAPGRSLFLFAPAVTIGLGGARELARRVPAVAWFALSLVAVRTIVIACRSDWYGGWAIGPRHLVPVLPMAIVPLALVLARWQARGRAWRAALVAAMAGAVGLSGYLASRSIFEWLFVVGGSPTLRASGLRLMEASHWQIWANPIVGFVELQPDVLAVGAWRLAERGHPGLLMVFGAIAALGAVALVVLVRAVAHERRG